MLNVLTEKDIERVLQSFVQRGGYSVPFESIQEFLAYLAEYGVTLVVYSEDRATYEKIGVLCAD